MSPDIQSILVCWPSWTVRDGWRWVMLLLALLLIAHSIFSRNMRMRDSSTWRGILRGRVVTKRWQNIYMRTLYVVIGVGALVLAVTFDCPSK